MRHPDVQRTLPQSFLKFHNLRSVGDGGSYPPVQFHGDRLYADVLIEQDNLRCKGEAKSVKEGVHHRCVVGLDVHEAFRVSRQAELSAKNIPFRDNASLEQRLRRLDERFVPLDRLFDQGNDPLIEDDIVIGALGSRGDAQDLRPEPCLLNPQIEFRILDWPGGYNNTPPSQQGLDNFDT